MSVAMQLSMKNPVAKLKMKTTQELEAELFANARFGTFSLLFAVNDETVKANKSDGFLALKPRGHGLLTRHFVLASDQPLPTLKDLQKFIEARYGHSDDYKVAQFHCKPRSR